MWKTHQEREEKKSPQEKYMKEETVLAHKT